MERTKKNYVILGASVLLIVLFFSLFYIESVNRKSRTFASVESYKQIIQEARLNGFGHIGPYPDSFYTKLNKYLEGATAEHAHRVFEEIVPNQMNMENTIFRENTHKIISSYINYLSQKESIQFFSMTSQKYSLLDLVNLGDSDHRKLIFSSHLGEEFSEVRRQYFFKLFEGIAATDKRSLELIRSDRNNLFFPIFNEVDIYTPDGKILTDGPYSSPGKLGFKLRISLFYELLLKNKAEGNNRQIFAEIISSASEISPIYFEQFIDIAFHVYGEEDEIVNGHILDLLMDRPHLMKHINPRKKTLLSFAPLQLQKNLIWAYLSESSEELAHSHKHQLEIRDFEELLRKLKEVSTPEEYAGHIENLLNQHIFRDLNSNKVGGWINENNRQYDNMVTSLLSAVLNNAEEDESYKIMFRDFVQNIHERVNKDAFRIDDEFVINNYILKNSKEAPQLIEKIVSVFIKDPEADQFLDSIIDSFYRRSNGSFIAQDVFKQHVQYFLQLGDDGNHLLQQLAKTTGELRHNGFVSNTAKNNIDWFHSFIDKALVSSPRIDQNCTGALSAFF